MRCSLLFWSFGTILRSGHCSSLYPWCIKRTTHDVILYTRKVFYPSASYQDDRVLLKIVSFTADIGDDLISTCESDFCYLSQCRVWLLWCSGIHSGADASSLRTAFQCWWLGFLDHLFAFFTNQLVNSWQIVSFLVMFGSFLSELNLAVTPCKATLFGSFCMTYRQKNGWIL